MLRTSRWLTLFAGIVAIGGCSRQDADALARIGQLVVDKAKSLPEVKSQSKEKPPINADQKDEHGKGQT